MTANTKGIVKYLLSGLLIAALSFAIVAGANKLMKDFIADETREIAAAAELAERMRLRAEQTENEQERLHLEMETLALKAEKMEAFYQKYKKRDSYHYYGQYYEIFENVYEPDVIFIETSHCAHGVNPLYIEEENPEYSFFNFALNGSVPSFYKDWYEIFENEAEHPLPKVIIWCVDWFMCDTGWLWRRITFDSPADMPLGIMRAIRKEENKLISSVEASPAPEDEGAPEQTAQTAAAEADEGEKTVLELLRASVKEHGLFALDEHLTVFLLNNPIFSSRDRIPEMIRYYMNGRHAEVEKPVYVEPTFEGRILSEDDLVLPVYKHEFLRDPLGNLTSDYYKGYIPWEADYAGSNETVGCIHNRDEWNTFLELLDHFEEEGIKLIFVQCPEYSGANCYLRPKYNEQLAKVAEKRGIPFLNYNEELASDLNSDPSNYSDWGHMSKKGSTAFSKILAKDLKPVLAEVTAGEE